MSVADLTGREREVLEAMAGGLTNKAIGKRLFMAERTVERYTQNVFAKLDLSPRNPAWNVRVVAVLKWLEVDR